MNREVVGTAQSPVWVYAMFLPHPGHATRGMDSEHQPESPVGNLIEGVWGVWQVDILFSLCFF